MDEHTVAQRLFGIPELMTHTLELTGALTIIKFGKTSSRGREYMQETLATLIRKMLEPYFPDTGEQRLKRPQRAGLTLVTANQRMLMFALQTTKGGISGSSTLQVLLPYEVRGYRAPNLNIVVPRGEFHPMAIFLFDQGYTWCRNVRVTEELLNTVEHCVHFRHSNTRRLVILTESVRPTILNVVVEGRNTAAMNVITGRNIYSLYPAFTARGQAFCGVVEHNMLDTYTAARQWNINLRNPLIEPPFSEPTRCGVECGRRRRRLAGGRGIGLVCWKKDGVEHGDVFEDQRMSWTLSGRCINPECRDKEPKLYQLEG